MLFNASLQLGTGEADIVLVIGHDQACDFLTDSIRQSYYAQFLDVRRIRIGLLQLVRINILAVRVDNDLFRAPDQVKIAVVIKPAEISRIQPTLYQRFSSCIVVFEITEHHVWTTRDNLTDSARVRLDYL